MPLADVSFRCQNTELPIQGKELSGVLVASLRCLQRRVIVALLKLKTGLRIAFFQRAALMIFAAKKTEQRKRQDDPAYPGGGAPPLPPVPPPSAPPCPDEHICTRNIFRVRECLCTVTSARRITPNLGMQMIEP